MVWFFGGESWVYFLKYNFIGFSVSRGMDNSETASLLVLGWSRGMGVEGDGYTRKLNLPCIWRSTRK